MSGLVETAATKALTKTQYLDARRKLKRAAASGSYSDFLAEVSALPSIYAWPSGLSAAEVALNDLCVRLALKVLALQNGQG